VSALVWVVSVVDLPSHVVTSFLQLDHSFATVASLPPLLFRHLNQTIGLLILWTLASTVELAVAEYTHFGVASAATGVFSLGGQIYANLGWLDPFTTAPCRAVESILGGVFLVFFVPEGLELVVEESIGVFQRNMVLGTASRRHMLWVLN
jgi:hypothetical protein